MLTGIRYGCLMIKHIVESFDDSKFTYIKYFSKFLDTQTKKTRKIVKEYDARHMDTTALEVLYATFFDYISYWDRKHLSAIIELSIRKSQIFRGMIVDAAKIKSKFVQLMSLGMSESILNLIYKSIKCFVNWCSLEMLKCYLCTTCFS